jgi:hypothetical protein
MPLSEQKKARAAKHIAKLKPEQIEPFLRSVCTDGLAPNTLSLEDYEAFVDKMPPEAIAYLKERLTERGDGLERLQAIIDKDPDRT